MGKSEPTLIPEWLKNSGNSGRSFAHSDDRGQSKLTRNRSFANNNSSNGRDFGRSFSSDRTTSSYFLRSSSSNGSGNIRHRSSSNRNPHDREWEKDRYKSNDREKTLLGERWRRDSSDSPKSTPLTRFDRDGLRRSQSMVSGKRGDTWHQKVPCDSDDYGGKSKNCPHTKNSPIGGAKTNFEREYPSLGLEERVVTSGVRRVSSPVLSSVTQSFPISISSAIGGEKWTSALAEVPGLVVNSGTSGSSSSSQHMTVGTSASVNMAEAVVQGPGHAQTIPQFSAGTQRFEDLSLKQFRQLIPVTPLLPKALNKAGQLQNISPSSLPHSPLGGPVNGEVSKAKLHILKPVGEHNGVQTPTSKDKLSPTIGTKPVTSALAPSSDHKAAPTLLEKRPTSQARSRNEFFNSVRKKSMANTFLSTSNPLSVSDNVVESPCFPIKTDSEPVSSIADALFNVSPGLDCGYDSNFNVDTNERHLSNGMEQAISDLSIPDEKEAAFLRSLGWEEDSDEGGLTEEEINAFIRDAAKYMVSKPTPLNVLEDLQLKNTSDSQVLGIDGISSARRPSNGKLH